MIIRQPQLKAARRHAQRVGEQVGDALDNGHDGVNGVVVERLLATWTVFIAQFGDDEALDSVARDYVAGGFRAGVATTSPRHLTLFSP